MACSTRWVCLSPSHVTVSGTTSWFSNPLPHLLCAAGKGSHSNRVHDAPDTPAPLCCLQYLACYLDSSSLTVDIADEDTTAPPSRPQCILVIHNSPTGQGRHFSSFVIDPQQSVVHAFDTMGARWPDSRVTAVLHSLFPNLDLFEQHGYRLCNSTGVLRQTGASCRPWALWTLVAYVFNFRGCRDESGDGADSSRLQGGVLPFWRAVTC